MYHVSDICFVIKLCIIIYSFIEKINLECLTIKMADLSRHSTSL